MYVLLNVLSYSKYKGQIAGKETQWNTSNFGELEKKGQVPPNIQSLSSRRTVIYERRIGNEIFKVKWYDLGYNLWKKVCTYSIAF